LIQVKHSWGIARDAIGSSRLSVSLGAAAVESRACAGIENANPLRTVALTPVKVRRFAGPYHFQASTGAVREAFMFALILASLALFATLAVLMAGLRVTGSVPLAAKAHSAIDNIDERARRAGL